MALSKFQLDEERKEKVTMAVAVAGMSFLGFCLVILFGGPTFYPVLDAIGIKSFIVDERGVYADCSRGSNRNNRFCGGSGSYQNNQNPRNSIPFSLSE